MKNAFPNVSFQEILFFYILWSFEDFHYPTISILRDKDAIRRERCTICKYKMNWRQNKVGTVKAFALYQLLTWFIQILIYPGILWLHRYIILTDSIEQITNLSIVLMPLESLLCFLWQINMSTCRPHLVTSDYSNISISRHRMRSISNTHTHVHDSNGSRQFFFRAIFVLEFTSLKELNVRWRLSFRITRRISES